MLEDYGIVVFGCVYLGIYLYSYILQYQQEVYGIYQYNYVYINFVWVLVLFYQFYGNIIIVLVKVVGVYKYLKC